MINLRDLNFAYRRQPLLFDSLNLQLESGHIYGLLGRNGAGKTSLLHILSGLIFHQSGEVEVMGFQPRRRQQPFLADLFFLAEDHYIPKIRISRFEKRYAPFYPKFDEGYFAELLRDFDLERGQHLGKLSSGERKKALIAFGLATHCRLMLMDEPTSGLDIPSKKQFRQLIAKAASPERSFLISTHQARDLHGVIDPIIILDQGKIILQEGLASIGGKVAFRHRFQKPVNGEALYYEEVSGGYICLERIASDDPPVDVDVEALFNAVISRPALFRELFPREVIIPVPGNK